MGGVELGYVNTKEVYRRKVINPIIIQGGRFVNGYMAETIFHRDSNFGWEENQNGYVYFKAPVTDPGSGTSRVEYNYYAIPIDVTNFSQIICRVYRSAGAWVDSNSRQTLALTTLKQAYAPAGKPSQLLQMYDPGYTSNSPQYHTFNVSGYTGIIYFNIIPSVYEARYKQEFYISDLYCQ